MDNYKNLAGTTSPTFNIVNGPDGSRVSSGNGPPNGIVNGALGDLYIDLGTEGDDGGLLWVKNQGAGDNLGWGAHIQPRFSTLMEDASTGVMSLLLQNSFLSKGGSIDVTATLCGWNSIPAGLQMAILLNGSPLPPAFGSAGANIVLPANTPGSMTLLYRIDASLVTATTIQNVQLWWSANGGGVATIDVVSQAHGPVGASLRTQEVFP